MSQLSLWLLFAAGVALLFNAPSMAGLCVCFAVMSEMLFGDDDDDFDDGEEVGVDVPFWRRRP